MLLQQLHRRMLGQSLQCDGLHIYGVIIDHGLTLLQASLIRNTRVRFAIRLLQN